MKPANTVPCSSWCYPFKVLINKSTINWWHEQVICIDISPPPPPCCLDPWPPGAPVLPVGMVLLLDLPLVLELLDLSLMSELTPTADAPCPLRGALYLSFRFPWHLYYYPWCERHFYCSSLLFRVVLNTGANLVPWCNLAPCSCLGVYQSALWCFPLEISCTWCSQWSLFLDQILCGGTQPTYLLPNASGV